MNCYGLATFKNMEYSGFSIATVLDELEVRPVFSSAIIEIAIILFRRKFWFPRQQRRTEVVISFEA